MRLRCAVCRDYVIRGERSGLLRHVGVADHPLVIRWRRWCKLCDLANDTDQPFCSTCQ